MPCVAAAGLTTGAALALCMAAMRDSRGRKGWQLRVAATPLPGTDDKSAL